MILHNIISLWKYPPPPPHHYIFQLFVNALNHCPNILQLKVGPENFRLKTLFHKVWWHLRHDDDAIEWDEGVFGALKLSPAPSVGAFYHRTGFLFQNCQLPQRSSQKDKYLQILSRLMWRNIKIHYFFFFCVICWVFCSFCGCLRDKFPKFYVIWCCLFGILRLWWILKYSEIVCGFGVFWDFCGLLGIPRCKT